MANPSLSPEVEILEREQLVPLYRVVLLDDNDHTYDYVIEMLQKIFIFTLDQAYRQLVTTDAVCKPRTDIQIPTRKPGKVYQWSSVEGGSTSGYFAIRMKSDIIYEQEYNGARTQEKYCMRPGTYCGLIGTSRLL